MKNLEAFREFKVGILPERSGSLAHILGSLGHNLSRSFHIITISYVITSWQAMTRLPKVGDVGQLGIKTSASIRMAENGFNIIRYWQAPWNAHTFTQCKLEHTIKQTCWSWIVLHQNHSIWNFILESTFAVFDGNVFNVIVGLKSFRPYFDQDFRTFLNVDVIQVNVVKIIWRCYANPRKKGPFF